MLHFASKNVRYNERSLSKRLCVSIKADFISFKKMNLKNSIFLLRSLKGL